MTHPLSTTAQTPSGESRYDSTTIALHWLTALLVLALFLISQIWGFYEKPDRAPFKLAHTSLGVLLTVVIVARLAWRLFFAPRIAAANTGLANIAAKLVHGLLYALLAVQLWLGFMIGWSGRRAAVNAFGWEIPSPFAPFTREDHHFFEEIHDWVGWSIILLAVLHAAAALFHHYVLRDNLLARMMPARN